MINYLIFSTLYEIETTRHCVFLIQSDFLLPKMGSMIDGHPYIKNLVCTYTFIVKQPYD